MENVEEQTDINWHKSICPYCGFGCGVMVGVAKGKIAGIRGLKGHPVNDGDICAIAAALPEVFAAEGRLKEPMVRREDKLTPVEWGEAIKLVADEFRQIIEKHGPKAFAFYGGAANLTEEYYLMNKLMKACIGSNNMECSTRLCMASTAVGFLSTLGVDAPPACYDDIEQADLFLIAGNNMAVSVPVLFRRVLAAKKKNRAGIIVADPRKTKTTEAADIHLQLRAGTDVALNNGLAHVLLKEGFIDEDKIQSFTSGLDDLKELLKDYPPSRVSEITGCPEAQIIEAACAIGKAKAMLYFWFMGYNHSSQAVFKNNSLHNLGLLTGNFCRPGAGPLSITGEANTLGNRMVGALSHLLPGGRAVTNPQHRQEVADFWGLPVEKINATPGRSILDIIKGLHSGDVRALWIMTTNPAVSLPDSNWVREGLKKAELLVVQDIFPTETIRLADVVFPAAQWCEKTGTFINSERRVELVEKLVDPPGKARPDYEIIWLVARAMGYKKEFPYSCPEEVFEEYKRLTRGRICDMSGVSYARLREQAGLQLPCPAPDHPGTPRLFTDRRFPRIDGRAALLPREYNGPAETTDSEYPFVLLSGRLSRHFNTRSRTGRSKLLNNQAPDNIIDLHPEDACRLCLQEGEGIKVISRRGTAQGSVQISDNVLPGNVYMNMHYGSELGIGEGHMANLLTNAVYDIHSKQPEFKYCAVKIEKL